LRHAARLDVAVEDGARVVGARESGHKELPNDNKAKQVCIFFT
jgi:hypothetical protein